MLVNPAADQGWFHGTLQKNRKTGLFPGNYVQFNKKQSKKFNAMEARANLMQKSSTLAQKTRTAGTTNPMISNDTIVIDKHKLSNPDTKNVENSSSEKIVAQITRTFSDTALKSNESLLEKEYSTMPRVGKRPPLLLSNQAYAGLMGSIGEDNDSKAPPPRPFKPVSLRSIF